MATIEHRLRLVIMWDQVCHPTPNTVALVEFLIFREKASFSIKDRVGSAAALSSCPSVELLLLYIQVRTDTCIIHRYIIEHSLFVAGLRFVPCT